MRYLLRRSSFYALAALFSLALNFFLPRMMPGDPSSALFARFQGQLQPEALAALREAFGFTDQPLPLQFLTYLRHVAQGDLGLSVAYFPAPVSTVIGTGLSWTVFLAGSSVLVSFTLGTLLGIWAAWRRGGWVDRILLPILSFISAFPYFWLAMAALFVGGFTLEWFPLRHAYSDDLTPALTVEFAADALGHAALPAATIVVATLAGWTLSMRNTMLGVLGSEYVSLARAKGLPVRQVMLRYAARSSLLPNITGFGMALGFVLGGSLLTELVFSYPGTGYLLVQAVRTQDYPLMQGLFLIITLAVLAANLLVDVVYLWLDPRTRA